jgi:hypothetical protein
MQLNIHSNFLAKVITISLNNMSITRIPTPDELQKIAAAGGDPAQYAGKPLTFLTPEEQAGQQGQIGTGATIGRTLIAHGGGILGGGAGMIGASALGYALAPETFGASLLLPLGVGIAGSMGGSYAGQKLQEGVESPETYAAQQQAAEEAAQANPKTALATDIIGSAIASGGRPSMDALRAGGYLLGKVGKATMEEGAEEAGKKALIGTLMNAGVNPAINTGVSLANGQGLPSGSDLAAQVAGGAIFSRQAKWAAKLTGHAEEPAPEVTNGNDATKQEEATPLGDITTSFTKKDDAGNYTIGDKSIKSLFLKQFAEPVKKIEDPIAKAEAQTRNELLSNLHPDDMRQQLHVAAMAEKAKSIVGANDLDAGLRNAEEPSNEPLPWQEPKQEVTNSPKTGSPEASIKSTETPTSQASPAPQASANAQDFLKAKMEDLQQSGIGSKVTEPVVLPKVNPVVEEAKARDRAERQDNTQPKTPAELAEEQFLTKGNLNAPPSEDSTKPKFKGTQKGAGNIPDTDYYNLVHPIMDSNGQVIHGAGSTVSEHTLRKYGVDFDEKGVKSNKFSDDKPNQAQVKLATAIHEGSQPGKKPVTLGEALQFLVAQNHPFSKVFRDMLNSRNAKLNTPIVHDPSLNEYEGQGVHRQTPTGSEIALPTDSLLHIPTILHEGIHALEHQVLPMAGEGIRGMAYLDHLQKFIADPASNPHAVEMVKAYLESAKQEGIWTKLFGKNGTAGDDPTQGVATQKAGANYGFSNVHEFSAHKFDPEFQAKLKSQKWGDTTVWKRIVSSLQKFLGIHDGTMFDRLMSASKKVQKSGKEKTNDYITRQSQNKVERSNKFLINGAELVKDPTKLGLRPNSSGAYNGTQLLGTLMNKLSPMEQEIYRREGIEQYFGGRTISQADAAKWMEEHSPKAEVHSYGMEGKVSEAKKEYDKMTHEWLETLPREQRSRISSLDNVSAGWETAMRNQLTRENWTKENIDKAIQYENLGKKVVNESRDTSPHATSAYSHVSALPTDEPMPEWTTTKSGKNVQRVDVVVPPKPGYQSKAEQMSGDNWKTKEQTGVLWSPDNLHENLPNTLGWAMIQYKTGPKGEKIAVIAEAQSRWGQEQRKYEQIVKENKDSGMKRGIADYEDKSDSAHPLLRDYNRLILKAAIEQAKKEGATHIMVSDAKSALMTEMLDTRYKENPQGKYEHGGKKYDSEHEGGFKLNYDTILPKIAEELTGSKGERVSLGEHKNAYIDKNITDEVGMEKRQRDNLIFRNADGTPKTDVSGRLYPIHEVPDREPMLYGKRYAPPKPPEGQSHTPEELRLPPDKYMGKFGAAFRSVLDKVRDIAKPHAQLVADAATQAVNKETELRGRWKNAIVQAGENLNKIPKDRVMAAFNHEMATKTSGLPLLRSAAERNFYNKARQLLHDSGKYRLDIGEPVTEAKSVNGKTIYTKRDLKQDAFYFPGMANQKIQQTYRNNTDHAAIAKLDQEFHDYNTKTLGLSESASQERIDNYKKALQGSIKNSDVSHQDYFNAHRKAQGTPLPPSFRETDPVRNLERYFDRAAIDASHYEFMEKNHKVLAALGQEKDAWNNKVVPEKGVSSLANNPAVKALLEHWKGEPVSPAEGNEQSISSLVSSAFISGPALELHKTVSNIVKTLSLSSNPIVLAKAVTHAMGNTMRGYNTAVENGVVKLTARSAMQMVDGNATAAERLQAASRIIRKVSTLNDLTTKVSTGLVQSMNEVIIPSKIARGAAGDVTAQKFLRNLDPTYDPNRVYSPEEIKQLASRSANYIHGTGDIRSMPAWMLNDSEFSGFFSLAHWSIAQTNNFMKDIYEPATRGDIKPLITGIFGAAVGGYIIKELRQDIQGKKSTIPSLVEIASKVDSQGRPIGAEEAFKQDKGLVAYNMIAAMQFAGFGGLLSQLAKYPFDAAYKNNPQGATFPMDEVASDFASTLHEVSTAIANDPNVNWVDLAKAVTMHTLSTNFQLSRIAINQGINNGLITGLPAEKKMLSDKMGQLRRFDMVEGLPYNEIDEASNPYMNLSQKKFKMEQDPQKAIQQLPALVQNIMETYHNNPDVMMSKLKSLKQNEYSTFPSMENMPLSVMKYIGYLQQMEGADKAQEELQDYMKHKIVNEVKSSMVP